MSFDYGSNDRDRDRGHSDRRGHGQGTSGYGDGNGYNSGGRTAVHDSYERDREYAREAGYDERGTGHGGEDRGYGGRNDEGTGEYSSSRAAYDGRNDEGTGEYSSSRAAYGGRNAEGTGEYPSSHAGYGREERSEESGSSEYRSRRNERERENEHESGSGEYGSGRSKADNNRSGSGYNQDVDSYGSSETRNRRNDYDNNERQSYGDSGRRDDGRDNYNSTNTRRYDDADNNSSSAAYQNNSTRDSHTGSVGLSGGNASTSKHSGGGIDWQSVGTQVAVAGIQHFAKSYDKASEISTEEQKRIDEADGVGGSHAKESAFAKKLGERKGETAKLGEETGDLKDKLVEGGLGFLKGAFGGHK